MVGPACQANALSAAAMAQPAGSFQVPGMINEQILDAQHQIMASVAAASMPGGHMFGPHNQQALPQVVTSQALAQVATGQASIRAAENGESVYSVYPGGTLIAFIGKGRRLWNKRT